MVKHLFQVIHLYQIIPGYHNIENYNINDSTKNKYLNSNQNLFYSNQEIFNSNKKFSNSENILEEQNKLFNYKQINQNIENEINNNKYNKNNILKIKNENNILNENDEISKINMFMQTNYIKEKKFNLLNYRKENKIKLYNQQKFKKQMLENIKKQQKIELAKIDINKKYIENQSRFNKEIKTFTTKENINDDRVHAIIDEKLNKRINKIGLFDSKISNITKENFVIFKNNKLYPYHKDSKNQIIFSAVEKNSNINKKITFINIYGKRMSHNINCNYFNNINNIIIENIGQYTLSNLKYILKAIDLKEKVYFITTNEFAKDFINIVNIENSNSSEIKEINNVFNQLIAKQISLQEFNKIINKNTKTNLLKLYTICLQNYIIANNENIELKQIELMNNNINCDGIYNSTITTLKRDNWNNIKSNNIKTIKISEEEILGELIYQNIKNTVKNKDTKIFIFDSCHENSQDLSKYVNENKIKINQ